MQRIYSNILVLWWNFMVNLEIFSAHLLRNVAPQGLDYLKGQLLLESRRNMSRMSVEIVDEDEQSLSHFISNSPWEDEPLIEAIGKRAVELLSQDEVSGALILDESGIPK